MRDLVVIGAGGFGRETIDTVLAINDVSPTWRLLGVVDDALSNQNAHRLKALGVPYLGALHSLPEGSAVAVAVGDPSVRRSIVQRLEGRVDFPSLLHPSTIIGSSFWHGVGLIILAGVSIGTNVAAGDHVHLNAHAVLGHDAVLDDYVSVNPNATVSGEVHIGAATLVGAGSVVLQGLAVSKDSTVGAGACVTHDVAAPQTLVGIPARPLARKRNS